MAYRDRRRRRSPRDRRRRYLLVFPRREPGNLRVPMSASRFRRVALGLPGVIEASHQGHPDFRVGKRIFATLGYPDDDWGMVKLSPAPHAKAAETGTAIFRPVPGGWRRV